MIGIAFDLRWMKFVRLDEHAARVTAERHRGREIERASVNEILRLLHIWNDGFSRLKRPSA